MVHHHQHQHNTAGYDKCTNVNRYDERTNIDRYDECTNINRYDEHANINGYDECTNTAPTGQTTNAPTMPVCQCEHHQVWLTPHHEHQARCIFVPGVGEFFITMTDIVHSLSHNVSLFFCIIAFNHR